MKSLWSFIQGGPVFMQRVNGWLTIVWIAMIPNSIATGWINSVAYVASLSLGHSYRVTRRPGRRPEWKSPRGRKRSGGSEDTAGEIVDRVVEQTTVEKQT